MNRPLLKLSHRELDAELQLRRDDAPALRALAHELAFRATKKSKELLSRVHQALERLEKRETKIVEGQKPETPAVTLEPPPKISEPVYKRPHVGASERARAQPLASAGNAPSAILDAWTALEVLSPPTFRRPEDLASGDLRAVANLNRGELPWEGEREKARPNTKLYYQVSLGTIDFGEAVAQLLQVYSDLRAERPVARGHALIGSVILDRDGRLVEASPVSISSFAWSLPIALRGELGRLAEWQSVEPILLGELEGLFRRATTESEGEQVEKGRPLDRSILEGGWRWLLRRLELPEDLVAPPSFAIRSYPSYKSFDPPEPLLLNSFYLADLAAARELFAKGKVPSNLSSYVGNTYPDQRFDLLHDREKLEAAIAPSMIPAARWPWPGETELVLLQQAAVNLAFEELRERGILAVNGPPGTGKTTLLRDLVAGIVSARAEVLTSFDDPQDAFKHSGQKLKAGSSWLHLYTLDPRLRGFEVVVASSNNKAVENVSAELPERGTVIADLRHLKTLSDALSHSETWGLIAGVMGNRANRGRFQQTFWWDKDVGLEAYLATVVGAERLVEEPGAETGTVVSRPPRIVTEERPPLSHEEALVRWARAREHFRRSLAASRNRLAELEETRCLLRELPEIFGAERSAAARSVEALARENEANSCVEARRISTEAARVAVSASTAKLESQDQRKPGLWARLFNLGTARSWRAERGSIRVELERERQALRESEDRLATATTAAKGAYEARAAAEQDHQKLRIHLEAVRQRIKEVAAWLGSRFVDEEFFSQPVRERHKSVPWLERSSQVLRDRVFVAAMELHRAFLDAAAKPLRQNLGAFTKVLAGGKLPTAEKQALVLDLWRSFFLVVPVVSTTFASFGRMFAGVPEESLGWVLIDEAGQATPQSAVGPILRSLRAVVVGDPLQIEPVVVIPDNLTQSICRYFQVDPDRFNAPDASVQTLADRVSPFFTELDTLGGGSREVGVPLLVHRRCADPMFRISNQVAYGGLMVQARQPKDSAIEKALGPSSWFHVEGGGADKWSAEEGEVALAILSRLAAAGIKEADFFIVTPFVVVAQNLRRLVAASDVVSKLTREPRKWVESRIGTVHTVQGREAEAVLFVLGAAAPSQGGARAWAGSKPNLVNVAVTRAKECLYVVGNRNLWNSVGTFQQLHQNLPEGSLTW